MAIVQDILKRNLSITDSYLFAILDEMLVAQRRLSMNLVLESFIDPQQYKGDLVLRRHLSSARLQHDVRSNDVDFFFDTTITQSNGFLVMPLT
jgi:hypothetical protein